MENAISNIEISLEIIATCVLFWTIYLMIEAILNDFFKKDRK